MQKCATVGNGDPEYKVPPSSDGMCSTCANGDTKDKVPQSFGGIGAAGGNGYTGDKRPISFRRLASNDAQRINGESFFSPAQQVLTKQRSHSLIHCSALRCSVSIYKEYLKDFCFYSTKYLHI
jgi:hypothetical protein